MGDTCFNPESTVRRNSRCSFRPTSLRSGFTLLELVLAMALSAIVLYLIMTAIDLYMHRVDTSRARVESAQLSRALLDMIAGDVQSARYVGPQSSASGGGLPSGGSSNAGVMTGGGASSSANPNLTAQSGQLTSGSGGGVASGGVGNTSGGANAGQGNILGLYGSAAELRIDRTPPINWNRPTGEEQQTQEPVLQPRDLPQTVRYYFEDGDRQSAADYAKRGVSEKRLTGVAGLYRHTMPTAALPIDQPDAVTQGLLKDGAELLAPEVVSLEFAYFDGTQLLDAWDSAEQQALPRGVEIRMKVLKTNYDLADDATDESTLARTGYRERDLVEYRRFVSLTPLRSQPPTPMLSGAQGGGQGARRGQGATGQGGGRQNGAGQGGSQAGLNNGGGQNN